MPCKGCRFWCLGIRCLDMVAEESWMAETRPREERCARLDWVTSRSHSEVCGKSLFRSEIYWEWELDPPSFTRCLMDICGDTGNPFATGGKHCSYLIECESWLLLPSVLVTQCDAQRFRNEEVATDWHVTSVAYLRECFFVVFNHLQR